MICTQADVEGCPPDAEVGRRVRQPWTMTSKGGARFRQMTASHLFLFGLCGESDF